MMQEAVIDTERNMQRILDACDIGGHYQVASLSTTGLREPLVRVTILPNSAFKTGAAKIASEDWMKAFRKIWQEE